MAARSPPVDERPYEEPEVDARMAMKMEQYLQEVMGQRVADVPSECLHRGRGHDRKAVEQIVELEILLDQRWRRFGFEIWLGQRVFERRLEIVVIDGIAIFDIRVFWIDPVLAYPVAQYPSRVGCVWGLLIDE